jgi:hypothetical protein
MSLSKLSLGGNYDVTYKLFLPRENLVSGIPAEDANIGKLFLRCIVELPRKIVSFSVSKGRECDHVSNANIVLVLTRKEYGKTTFKKPTKVVWVVCGPTSFQPQLSHPSKMFSVFSYIPMCLLL